MDECPSDAVALLALLRMPGVGNTIARTALRAATQMRCNVKALLAMEPRAVLEALPPGEYEALAQVIGACRKEHQEAAQRLVARSTKAGITFITIDHDVYPGGVRDCLGGRAPALLSAIGEMKLLERSRIAVVGAREVSDAGRACARACGRDVGLADRVLVSGGAKGVDDAAQRGAVDVDGSIVVALPQGLITFRGESYIRDVLRERRALLLSACSPDAPWQQHAAVERNDIIAALAEAVCVIEPKKTGGSIRTARSALEFGRHVLVRCSDESASACDDLVRAGAIPLAPEGNWLPHVLTTKPQPRAKQAPLPGIE